MKLKPNIADFNVVSGDIDQLEHHINASLPDDYRLFLLQTNGGRVLSDGFFDIWSGTVSVPDKVVDSSGVVNFLGFTGINASSIYGNIKSTGRRYPGGVLPIATDGVGNVIHLGLNDPYHGLVFFWYHDGIPSWLDIDDIDERSELEQNSFDYLFFVSRTFTQFINNLRTE